FWTDEIAHPSLDDSEAAQFSHLGEINYMAQKRREALDFVSSHPGWLALQTLRRFAYTWTGFWSLPQHPIRERFDPEEPFDPANIAFCTALTFLALAGLRRAFLDRSETRWLYALVLAAFPLVYYVTRSHLRYRHPIDPELALLAVYAIANWRAPRAR